MRKNQKKQRAFCKPCYIGGAGDMVRCAAVWLLFCMLTVSVIGCGNGGTEISLEEMLEAGQNQMPSAGKADGGTDSRADKGTANTADGGAGNGTDNGTSSGTVKGTAGRMENGNGSRSGTVEMETVWVHLCGAVKVPGLYELPAGSRIYDAIMAAGGFTPEANVSYYNLAEVLVEGAKVQVPTEKEMDFAGEGSGTAGDAGGDSAISCTVEAGSLGDNIQPNATVESGSTKVNINTATAEQLQTLPGIGEKRAADIIAYREEIGGFRELTQLMEVSGIKEATYNKLKSLITLR